MVRVILLLSLVIISVGGFLATDLLNQTYSRPKLLQEEYKKVSQPLFLTPLIEKGQIREARKRSAVDLPNLNGIKSFSGYFTVNEECHSNLFFWFFPAQRNWKKAPVVLWLQGGPGETSLYGQFEELGPISFNKTLEKREYSWNVQNNIIFIDQPVGTGFSFTGKHCYANNETDVSKDLYSALIQFYQMFPSLQKNKFYITGESYGGHYVPSIGYTIHENNPSAKIKINLSGLMIGNGIMDDMYQSDYSSYLYQLGLIDNHQRAYLKTKENRFIKELKNNDWKLGFSLLKSHVDTLQKIIGNVSIYNFLKPKEDPPAPWEKYITTEKFRKTLHVGSRMFSTFNEDVYDNLQYSVVQSVKSKVEKLLVYYPVIFYHGQLDIVCGYPMAVNFFRNLHWKGSTDYLNAQRKQWCVKDVVAGYFKSAKNLHEVLVRAAGHMVPRDQPLWAFELINSVTSSPSDDPLRQLRICDDTSE